MKTRLIVAAASLALGCSSSTSPAAFSDAGKGPGGGNDAKSGTPPRDAQALKGPGDASQGDAAASGVVTPTSSSNDFPKPILDGNAPSNSATLFGPADSGAASGGPCMFEPEDNVLYPQNWLRPRFSWTAGAGQTLFEIRLHVANQKTDYIVYTTNTTYTMAQADWDNLRNHSPTEAMTLTIRGGVYAGGSLTGVSVGSSYPFGVAPVQATGAIVYWTTSTGTALKGFTVGDTTVAQVLIPSQVKESPTPCIGCHTSTPDGEFVGLSYQANLDSGANGWPNAVALVDPDAGTVGAAPSFLGSGGAAAMAQYNRGISTFSKAHWSTGDHHLVTAYDDGAGTTNVLTWVDLEATSLSSAAGTIARNGDTSQAGSPAWSHDGNTIAYTSTNKFCSGRLGAGCDGEDAAYNGPNDPGSTADIYTVPYANGAGGTAAPLPGASSATVQEYYPIFSPDDSWLAFNETPNDTNLYDQADAEVWVIPSAGGTATRLAANDPPSCTGQTSPGLTNSWPKWGPTAPSANGNTYYWLVFSSKRSLTGASQPGAEPQLYITSMVVNGGKVSTFGSIYLWNQPATEGNHTPAWDAFKVPPAGTIPK